MADLLARSPKRLRSPFLQTQHLLSHPRHLFATSPRARKQSEENVLRLSASVPPAPRCFCLHPGLPSCALGVPPPSGSGTEPQCFSLPRPQIFSPGLLSPSTPEHAIIQKQTFLRSFFLPGATVSLFPFAVKRLQRVLTCCLQSLPSRYLKLTAHLSASTALSGPL